MSTDQPTETFRPILGYPLYRVSDWGRIQSRRDWLKSSWSKDAAGNPWYDLKPTINPKDGYYYVRLYRDRKSRGFKVHRLVLEAFVGPCPEGHVACHGDGCRTNNRLDNLRWDTIRGNLADKRLHGTDSRGSRNVNAKLTEVDIVEIRRLGSEGEKQHEIAARFGISRSQISMILSRRVWDHIDDGYPVNRRRVSPRTTKFRPSPPESAEVAPDSSDRPVLLWEEFRPFPDFLGYRVSNFGRVQSCRRQGSHSEPDPNRWHDIRPDLQKTGYLAVHLMRDRLRIRVLIHRAVLEAFIGPCPSGMLACHADGDKTNNHLSNLRWDTQKSNSADRVRHGTNGVKLRAEDIPVIRSLCDQGLSYVEIARRFGVHSSLIGMINRGTAWSNAP